MNWIEGYGPKWKCHKCGWVVVALFGSKLPNNCFHCKEPRKNEMNGIIKTLKKTFGFIRSDRGLEYFFHARSMDATSNVKLEGLREGDRVTFEEEVTQSPKGPRAERVRLA